MQLKQVKVAQLEQRLYEMQSKFERQQDQRSDLVKQLQKVMEAQWSEALRIINNGKTPVPQDNSSSTIDQLHSLQSKSYQNMEALLSQNVEEKARNHHYSHNGNEPYHHYPTTDKKNHHRKENHGQRSSQQSKSRGNRQHDDGNLQRYINLVCEKYSNYSLAGVVWRQNNKGL